MQIIYLDENTSTRDKVGNKYINTPHFLILYVDMYKIQHINFALGVSFDFSHTA